MAHIVIALKFQEKQNHSVLQTFAQLIHDGMVAQALIYPAPVPTMAAFQILVTKYLASITACGTEGNRGPHSAVTQRDASAEGIKDALRSIVTYCQTTTPNDQIHFELVGFETVTQGPHTAIGVLAAPLNLRSKITTTTLSGQTPLAVDALHGADTYNWYTAAVPTDPFVLIATTTEASYIATGAGGRLGYYTCRGVNAAGVGVETAPLAAHSQF